MDPEQLYPVTTDKATPAPAPFTGADRDYSINEFFRLMEIKLSTTTFRSNDDGLRVRLAWDLVLEGSQGLFGESNRTFNNVRAKVPQVRKRGRRSRLNRGI